MQILRSLVDTTHLLCTKRQVRPHLRTIALSSWHSKPMISKDDARWRGSSAPAIDASDENLEGALIRAGARVEV
jgi:hypothetical protein